MKDKKIVAGGVVTLIAMINPKTGEVTITTSPTQLGAVSSETRENVARALYEAVLSKGN